MIQDVFSYPNAHFLFIGGIAFISETSFVTCSEDSYLKRWELTEGPNPQITGPLCEVQASDAFAGVNDVCYHPQQKLVISCGDDHKIRLWRPENLEELGVLEGQELFEILGHNGEEITAAALSPDGKYLVTGDKQGNQQLREIKKIKSQEEKK